MVIWIEIENNASSIGWNKFESIKLAAADEDAWGIDKFKIKIGRNRITGVEIIWNFR